MRLVGVRAVAFDLDGTLFDHRSAATAGARAFLRSVGALRLDDAVALWFDAEQREFENWRSGRISFDEQRRRRLRSVLGQLGAEYVDEQQSLDQLFARYLVEYERAWRAYPDVVGVLDGLRGRGYSLGVLTNGSEEQQLRKLERIGILDLFDAVCVSEEIGAQKPDPRAFEILARRLDVAPSECAFVGDDPRMDVEGARTAGLPAVLVDRTRGETRGLAHAVATALDQAV